MKKADFQKSLKSMDASALKEEARKISEELMRLRFRRASQQEINSSLLSTLRRNLARVNTAMTAIAVS